MIGKISHGSDFGGLIKYLLQELKEAEIIGGAVGGTTPTEITQAFNDVAVLNANVKETVRHIVIAFSPLDGIVQNYIKAEIADKLMEKMGYGNAQYLVVAHQRDDNTKKSGDPQDTHNHDHIHIAANAVGLDGRWVDNSFDRYQIQKYLRELEIEYNLDLTKSNWETKDYVMKDIRKKAIKIEQKQPGYSGEKRIDNLNYIQQVIDNVAKSNPTMPDFIREIKLAGVDVKPKITRNKIIQGITYEFNGSSVRGLDLENASFPQLQKRGISYSPKKDIKEIEELELIKPTENIAIKEEITNQHHLTMKVNTKVDSHLEANTKSENNPHAEIEAETELITNPINEQGTQSPNTTEKVMRRRGR